MISCNSEENVQNEPFNETAESYELLAQELAAYNMAFYENHNIPLTKGKIWKKIKKVLTADAVGAIVGLRGGIHGSIVVGVGASIAAAFQSSSTNSISITDNSFTNSYQFVTNEGVGYLHNVIISEIEKENPGIYARPISEEELCNLLFSKITKYNLSMSKEDIRIAIRQAIQIVPDDNFESTEALMQYYKESIPGYNIEFNILGDFVDHVEPIIDNPKAVKDYYEGYKKTISSNVSLRVETQMNAILAIEVAANSAVLWNIKE